MFQENCFQPLQCIETRTTLSPHLRAPSGCSIPRHPSPSRLISAHTRPDSGPASICRWGYTDPELGKVDAAVTTSVRRRCGGCPGGNVGETVCG